VNKENIFEELNKMKNLMVAKAGTVISEQATNVGSDVGAIMQELNKFNSDEQKIVDIVKKYKSKSEFQNFLNQYKSISGKDFGIDVYRAIQPYNDRKEWDDLKAHLSSLGVALTHQVRDPRKGGSYAIFGGLTPQASAEDAAKVEEMWKDPKVSCVVSQSGAKKETLSNGTTAYLIGNVRYYGNGGKQLADGTMTNYNCSTEFKTKQPGQPTQSRQNVGDRFSKSVESLGVQGGKMDLQTLQTILKSLEGEQPIATAPTQGTPDLAQLTTALNQLNA
jgi:hypothetical protein